MSLPESKREAAEERRKRVRRDADGGEIAVPEVEKPPPAPDPRRVRREG